ncbi:MAG: hypothetical protein KGN32_11460 [Burkholderiales bacterium]|nr:hypothetical protein [Burkholderiales bacterium]
MTYLRHSVLSIAMAALSLGAVAQTDADHTQHHPEEQVKKSAKVANKVKAPNPAAKETMAAMDSKMKVMQEMHKKMMSAKTPEERGALMAEHMKMMQDGMSMMGEMNSMSGMSDMQGMRSEASKAEMSKDKGAQLEMMEKRMDMMTSMMQMMMDRLPATSAK